MKAQISIRQLRQEMKAARQLKSHTVFVCGRCFSGDKAGAQNTASVRSDGQVLIWDDVAGFYTSCHELTDEQIAVIGQAKPYATVSN